MPPPRRRPPVPSTPAGRPKVAGLHAKRPAPPEPSTPETPAGPVDLGTATPSTDSATADRTGGPAARTTKPPAGPADVAPTTGSADSGAASTTADSGAPAATPVGRAKRAKAKHSLGAPRDTSTPETAPAKTPVGRAKAEPLGSPSVAGVTAAPADTETETDSADPAADSPKAPVGRAKRAKTHSLGSPLDPETGPADSTEPAADPPKTPLGRAKRAKAKPPLGSRANSEPSTEPDPLTSLDPTSGVIGDTPDTEPSPPKRPKRAKAKPETDTRRPTGRAGRQRKFDEPPPKKTDFPTPPSDKTGANPLLLPLVLVLVAAVLAGLGFWFESRARDVRLNEALVDTGGTTEVSGQAREAVEKAFSYNFADVAATENAANELLVGQAKCQYNAIFGPVKTLAPEQKLVVSVKVVSSGVTSLAGDRATVLLFLDQVTTRTTDNQTGGGIAMMRVGAQRVDGRWKVDNMEMFGQSGDQSAEMQKCADAK